MQLRSNLTLGLLFLTSSGVGFIERISDREPFLRMAFYLTFLVIYKPFLLQS